MLSCAAFVNGGRPDARTPCCGCRLPQRAAEVPAQRFFLLLVRRADARPVQGSRLFEHALEGELAHRLAVLDHEGNVVGTYLEGGPRTAEASAGVEPETRIEEAGVVGT